MDENNLAEEITVVDLERLEIELTWSPKALAQQAAVGVVVTTVSWIVVSGIAGVLKRYVRKLEEAGEKAEAELKKL